MQAPTSAKLSSAFRDSQEKSNRGRMLGPYSSTKASCRGKKRKQCERAEGRPARRQASCHSLRSGGHSLWGQRFPLPFKKHVLRRCECARPHGETAVNGMDEKFLPHGGRSFSRAEWDEQQTKYKCIIRWIRAWYTRKGNIKQQRLSETWEDVRFFAHVAIHKNSKKPMTEPSLLY